MLKTTIIIGDIFIGNFSLKHVHPWNTIWKIIYRKCRTNSLVISSGFWRNIFNKYGLNIFYKLGISVNMYVCVYVYYIRCDSTVKNCCIWAVTNVVFLFCLRYIFIKSPSKWIMKNNFIHNNAFVLWSFWTNHSTKSIDFFHGP